MDKINEYLQRTLKVERYPEINYESQAIRPRMKCADGFEISVQASDFHYCSPRVSGNVKYDKVELGYPSIAEPLIVEYAEDDEDLTGTVYGWVPVEVVNAVVERHGGIVN